MPKIFVTPFKGGTTSAGKALDMLGFKTDLTLIGRHKILQAERRMLNDINSYLERFDSFLQVPASISCEIERLLGDKIRNYTLRTTLDGKKFTNVPMGEMEVFQDAPFGHELIHPYVKKIIYPDCKFIFMEREKEPYLKSVKNQLLSCALGMRGPVNFKKYSYCKDFFELAPNLVDELSWLNYERWRNAYVGLQQVFPGDILFAKISDGWAPLCNFFGLAEPDMPFPWENKSRELPTSDKTDIT